MADLNNRLQAKPAAAPAANADYIMRAYYFRRVIYAKIKYIAAAEGMTLTNTIDALLSAAIDDYEMEHGEIPTPEGGR